MIRNFDGVDDEIRCSIGSCNIGFGTFAVILKRGAINAWHAPIGIHNSSGTATFTIEISNGNLLKLNRDGGAAASTSTFTVLATDGWVLLAATKATGTATPRFHKYVFSTGVWTHQNGDATLANGGSATGGTVRFGEWQDTDDLNARLACGGIWGTALSDTAVEDLALTFDNWTGSSPVGCWKLNQTLTSTTLTDLTGNGANETTITGTSVVNESPPLLDFEDGPAVMSVATTNGGTASATPVINLPTDIISGNTLFAAVRVAAAGDIGWPSGWTEMVDVATDASDDQFAIAWRKADGTEGTTITLSSANQKFAGIVWNIFGATDPTTQAPELSTIATGTSTTPDPTTVTPTGGAKDYLWLWLGSWEGEQTSPPASNPTNYIGVSGADSGTAGAVTTNVRVAGAFRRSNAASEDPGSWTISASDDWTAYTVAFHPFVAGTPVSNTVISAVEALAGILQTRESDVETLQGITQTRESDVESLSGLSNTRIEVVESLQGISNARASNVEANALALVAREADIEARGVALQTRVVNDEALESALNTRQAVVESLTGLNVGKVANVEASTGLNIDKQVKVESLTSLLTSKQAYVEALTSLSTTKGAGIESLTGLLLSLQPAIESLSGLAPLRISNVEAIGSVASSRAAVVEALAGALNSAIAVLEALTGILTTKQTGVEALQGLIDSNQIYVEARGLEILAKTFLVTVESLSSVNSNRAALAESLSGIAVGADADLEAGQSAVRPIQSSLESLSSIARDALARVEATQLAAREALATLEAKGEAASTRTANLEAAGLLSVAKASSIEALARLERTHALLVESLSGATGVGEFRIEAAGYAIKGQVVWIESKFGQPVITFDYVSRTEYFQLTKVRNVTVQTARPQMATFQRQRSRITHLD